MDVAKEECADKVCLSLSATANSSGDNIMVMLYCKGLQDPKIRIIPHVEQKKKDKELLSGLLGHLDKNFAPHQLVSMALYEDAHPNNTKDFNCTILHTNHESKSLSEVVKGADEHSPEYKYKVFTEEISDPSESWEKVNKEARKYMNELGSDFGFLVSSWNKSSKDKACVSILSWNANNAKYF